MSELMTYKSGTICTFSNKELNFYRRHRRSYSPATAVVGMLRRDQLRSMLEGFMSIATAERSFFARMDTLTKPEGTRAGTLEGWGEGYYIDHIELSKMRDVHKKDYVKHYISEDDFVMLSVLKLPGSRGYIDALLFCQKTSATKASTVFSYDVQTVFVRNKVHRIEDAVREFGDALNPNGAYHNNTDMSWYIEAFCADIEEALEHWASDQLRKEQAYQIGWSVGNEIGNIMYATSQSERNSAILCLKSTFDCDQPHYECTNEKSLHDGMSEGLGEPLTAKQAEAILDMFADALEDWEHRSDEDEDEDEDEDAA